MENGYEFDGGDVIALGINEKGNPFVETEAGVYNVGLNDRLQGGMAYISVEEVFAIYEIYHAGQVVYSPRRS